MSWSKPQFEEKRFGFEVTMYIYQAPNLCVTPSQTEIRARQF